MSGEHDRIEQLLRDRATRLSHHEGLADRVFDRSVTRLIPPSATMRVAPSRAWRGRLALAASLSIAALGVLAVIFMNNGPQPADNSGSELAQGQVEAPVAGATGDVGSLPSDEMLVALLAGADATDIGGSLGLDSEIPVDGVIGTRETGFTDFAGEIRVIAAASLPMGGR